MQSLWRVYGLSRRGNPVSVDVLAADRDEAGKLSALVALYQIDLVEEVS